MRGLILDASAILSLVFREEGSAAVEAVIREAERITAPPHWAVEVGNALLMAERRRRTTPEDATEAMTLLRTLEVELDSADTVRTWTTSLTLARRHRLTLYDAAYLELALRRRLPLATLDAELRAAAAQEGVAALP